MGVNYGYIRVSTDKQGLSVTAQTERLEAWCKFSGIELAGVYADEDVSGSKALVDRPQGSELLATVAKGDTVIAVKLDRCFRDASDGLQTLFAWHKQGVTLQLIDSNTIASTDTATGFLTTAMQLVIAQYERMVCGERTSHALRSAQRNGKLVTRPDRVPYGKMLQTDGTLCVNGDEVGMAMRIGSLRKGGMSYQQIADEMNDSGASLRGKRLTRHSTRQLYVALSASA